MTARLDNLPIDHFTLGREGLLYASDGWGNVRRWDGLTDGYEDAGVPAPETAPLFSPIMVPCGFWSGTWTAYTRYVDRYGNVGNPSPPSVALTIADVSGTVEALSGTTPIAVTCANHGLTNAGRQDIPNWNVGNNIVIRWPDGTEEQLYYDVTSSGTFDLYSDSGLSSAVAPASHRTAGADWAQNLSGFTYSTTGGELGERHQGRLAGAPSGNTITTLVPHGLVDMGRPAGASDGQIRLGLTSDPWSQVWYFKYATASTLDLFTDDACASPASFAFLTVDADTWYLAQQWLASTLPAAVETVQILRTKNGSGAAAYVDQEGDRTLSLFHSFLADDDLGDQLVLIDPLTGDASYALRFGLPPDDKPFMAAVGGRMIACGDPVWTKGAVKVTNGSKTVTGIGTAWAGTFDGRLLTVQGADKSYEVESRSGQTLTLTETYGGTTDKYARYAVGPTHRNRRAVQWSEAGYPEGWYPLAQVLLPADKEGGPVAGIAAFDSAALILTENRGYRFSFVLDPATDGSVVTAADRGCVNHRSHVRADGFVYALDRRGVYRTDGRGADDVSGAIQNVFAGQDAKYRIQWRWKEAFHACLDPENDSVLFFVSLAGGPPRHALAYRLRSQAWEVLEYPVPLTCSSVARVGGRLRVVCGTEHGRVVVLNEGTRDGATAGTLSGSLTGVGEDTFADSAATFDAALVNAPVRIVSGEAAGTERIVVAVSGTELRVDEPWGIQPAAGDRYVVGGVNWRWRSGWFQWQQRDGETVRELALTYQPSEVASTLLARIFADGSDDPREQGVTTSSYGFTATKGEAELAIDATKTNGYAKRVLDSGKETRADGWRRVSVGLEGTTDGDRHSLYRLDLDGATQQ